jgi:biopolymer transport protein ExbD
MPIKLSQAHHDEEEARIEIVPLIDIMFFLLASMMLVSLGAVRLKLLKADLPVAVAGKPSKSAPPATLSVDKDGFLRLDGKALALEEAAATLRRMAEADPDLRIVVAADRAARHEFVLRALDVARSAGIDRVAFAAKASDGK